MKPVLGPAFHRREASGSSHVAFAGTVDELLGAQSFHPRLAADDTLGNATVLLAHIDETRVQQQFHSASQQHLLKHDGQDLVVENGTILVDGVERPQVREYLVEHFSLAMKLAAEVGDPARCHIATGDRESFHQDHLRAGTSRTTCSRHACDAAANHRHVGFVTDRDFPGVSDFVAVTAGLVRHGSPPSETGCGGRRSH